MNARYDYNITNDEIYSELDSEENGHPANFESSETVFRDGLEDGWCDDDDSLLYDDILYDGTLSSLLQ